MHVHQSLTAYIHVTTCKRKHVHCEADTSTLTLMNTHTGRKAAFPHKHSLPKSSTVIPSHHTLDKPFCEPDKAGEGTQQPLNTQAGCIRQLNVPVDKHYMTKTFKKMVPL